MALIDAALERRIPIFAICRGLQELVVATGGTLYRRLFEQPELLNTAKTPNFPSSSNMRPRTKFRFRKEDYFPVNTGLQHVLGKLVTRQGAKTTGPRLRVEARSPDGLVEAVSVNDHPFALGVQWHPEWNSSEYALSRMLFEGFITACQSYSQNN